RFRFMRCLRCLAPPVVCSDATDQGTPASAGQASTPHARLESTTRTESVRDRRDADPMGIMRQVIVFDADDLAAESAFWAGMLDGRVLPEDDWHNVVDAD